MAFLFDLENAADVTPECLARAIDLVVTEFPGRVIESIYFGEDGISVAMFDGEHLVDFPVQRTGDLCHAH